MKCSYYVGAVSVTVLDGRLVARSTEDGLDTFFVAALERFMFHFEPLVSHAAPACYFLASTSATMEMGMVLNFFFFLFLIPLTNWGDSCQTVVRLL